MIENFNCIFQYLEKEEVVFDKPEFEFQAQSHPDYPTLLSIADTLSFFNIQNGAIRIDASKIDLLPDCFIAILKEENGKPILETKLYLIERKANKYFLSSSKTAIEISKAKLESRWNNIVLLVEKPKLENAVITNKNMFFWFLPFLCLVLFLFTLFQFQDNLQTKLFFIFPILGVLFSIAALKDLFGTKSELINSFCNITASTSCTIVVGSTKWKVFELVNFSDLSIVFFTSQFLGLFVFFFSGDAITYFSVQKILLLGAIPILILSVYYQKFVEKKWCPICLVIITVILLELVYLMAFQNSAFLISTKELIVFGFIFLSVMMIWSALKKLLTKQKELKEYQLKAIRFERNYAIFKNSLLAKDKAELPQSLIILGNKESKTKITVISNPFCGHCKGAHEVIETILEKHHNDVQIQVILKANLETENEESKKLFRSLIKIYQQNGESAFIIALKNWFNNKNTEEWFSLFPIKTTTEFDTVFNSQYKWCEENDYNFTPAIFVNGFEYPKAYNRESLEFFVNDLIEDEF
jgi:uncharacterized membrane protein